eukprot:s399_g13.t1
MLSSLHWPWACPIGPAKGPAMSVMLFQHCQPGKHFKNLEMDTQAFTRVTHAQALAHPCSSNPLFNAIPGLSTKFVRGDALHICFVHGVYSHLLGSILHYLCWFNPGRQNRSPQERLAVVWEALQKAYKELESPTRLSNLRLTIFTDPKNPRTSYPFLSIKGSEAKHMLPAFLVVCRSLLQADVYQERCMLDCMEHLQKVVDLYGDADIVLTTAEWEKFLELLSIERHRHCGKLRHGNFSQGGIRLQILSQQEIKDVELWNRRTPPGTMNIAGTASETTARAKQGTAARRITVIWDMLCSCPM